MLYTAKSVIRERLMRERDKLENYVNRAGFARKLTLKGASDSWSVKEVLALVLAREQFIADRLEEAMQNEAYRPAQTQEEFEAFLQKFGYPDFESSLAHENKSNDWVIEKYKTIALDEIVSQDIEAMAEILSALEKMPEEKLMHFQFGERVATHTIRHYRHHTARIGEWLRTIVLKQW